MNYPTLDQADLAGKTVLLRAGFDVPIKNGEVVDTTRIEAIADTMKLVLKRQAALIIIAHQGRPKAERDPECSQAPLVPVLEKLLGTTVQFADDCTSDATKTLATNLQPGQVLLLENLRYEVGEKSKDTAERDDFGKELASLAELAGRPGVYVNDAFTNCHRDHASMTSVPKFLPEKYMGLNVQREVEGIGQAVHHPTHPVLLAISGAKAETKVPVIEGFMGYGDHVLVGGCIANTFMAVEQGVGASKYDADWVDKAKQLLEQSTTGGRARIHVPTDAVAARAPVGDEPWPTEQTASENVALADLSDDMSIFDVGPQTIAAYVELVKEAKTIIWNGPLGFSELPQFAGSSKKLADAIVEATMGGATSVLGGGDTLAFLQSNGYTHDQFSYVSTAGGAMLDFIAGKELPALKALLG